MEKVTKANQLAELSKELGISLPTLKPPYHSKAMREHSTRMVEWARDHGFVITPVGYGYFVESYSKFNRCPCDENRPACPCSQAEQEIKIKGRCLCHLFWRDYQAFLDFRNGLEPKKEQ